MAASGRAPREAMARLNKEIAAIIKSPEYLEKFVNAFHYYVIGDMPEESKDFMKADRKVAGILDQVVLEAGFKAQ